MRILFAGLYGEENFGDPMNAKTKECSNEPKEKVGIISYNAHSNHMNYGAALHSYAFQQFLSSKGIASTIVNYFPKTLEGHNIKYHYLDFKRFWHVGGFIRFQTNWLLGAKNNIVKYNKFERFFKEHTNITSHVYHYGELMQTKHIEGEPYSCFISESDVIWKLYGHNDFDEVFFLNFPAASKSKKIAYAPSLSSRKFDDEELRQFKELVKDYSAISARERQGAEYMGKILGRDIPWVLDPTLLLSASDYTKIAIQPKEKNYILLYNCMTNDKQMVLEAERFAKGKGLQLIEVSNWFVNKIKHHHKVITDAGIEEFLGYFMNASFVICNAFHGFCFSIIFQKPMLLFQRDNSDYRMKNITDAFGLSARLIPYDNKHIPKTLDGIDWLDVNDRLSTLKRKSENFLLNAIHH